MADASVQSAAWRHDAAVLPITADQDPTVLPQNIVTIIHICNITDAIMTSPRFLKHSLLAISLSTLAACGGGGGDSAEHSSNDTGETPGKTIPRGSSGDSATLDQTTYTGEKLAAFNALNAARAAAGLPLAKQNTRLDQAAQAHEDYMANNGRKEGHSETEGKQGFTGKSSAYRAKAAGYENWIFTTEGIGGASTNKDISSEGTAQLGMQGLIRVLYHRVGALSPSLADVGHGVTITSQNDIKTVSLTVNYGDVSEALPIPNGYFIWPVDGATNIPGYMGGESPDPAPDLSDNQRGYPVSVTTASNDKLTVDVFKINCAGNDLPSRIITKDNDLHSAEGYLSNNWAFLLTEVALPRGSVCSVTFQGRSPALGRFNKFWSFNTEQ